MTASPEYLEYLVDMLAPLGPVNPKRMFGGAGLFRDGLMFALVADDTLYLKVDDETRADFDDAGSSPFTYEKKGKSFEMSYYELPSAALDDGEEFVIWAEKALSAAVRAKNRRPARNKRK